MIRSGALEALSRRLALNPGRAAALAQRAADSGALPKAAGRNIPELSARDLMRLLLAVTADRGLGNAAPTGRIWTYVRDDQPFGGTDPPAALFYYSRNRAGGHPQSHLAGYVGLMQADAFDGYNQLYKAQRKPAPILEAACWSHGRRKFFDLAKSGEAPIASEAVRRIDILFEIERTINGKTPEQRLAVRREKSAPIVADLEIWM